MSASAERLVPRWGRIVLLLLILLAAAARWYRLGAESLWLDEVLQGTLVENGLRELIPRLSLHAAAPLDYVLTYAMLQLGRQEFWLRFPATLFSLLTLPLVFQLGRRTLGWPAAAGLAAALLTVSPYALRYAQELRPYAAFGFWSSLASYFLLRALQSSEHERVARSETGHSEKQSSEHECAARSEIGHSEKQFSEHERVARSETGHSEKSAFPESVALWLAFLAVSIINLHTHLFALAVIAAQACWLGLLAVGGLLLRGRGDFREGWAWRWTRERWLWAVASLFVLAAVAAFSPWLPDYVMAVASRFLATISPGGMAGNPEAGQLIAQSGGLQKLDLALLRETAATLSTGQAHLANRAYALLAALGAAAALRRRPASVALLIALALIGPALVLLLLLSRQARFNPRYLIFVQPAYLLLVGAGIMTLGQGLQSLLGRIGGLRRLPATAITVSALTLLLMQGAWPSLQAYYQRPREDWRGAARTLFQVMQPEDVFVAPNALTNYVAFYWPDLRDHRQAGRTLDQIQAIEAGRLWLLSAPYNRETFDEATLAWLRDRRTAVLGIPPEMSLYLVISGQDALAELDGLVQGSALMEDPRWRSSMMGAHAIRARDNLTMGDAVAARQQLTLLETYGQDSRYWSVYVEVGNAQREQGDLKTAIASLRQALALSPDNPEVLVPLAYANFLAGRTGGAEAQFRRAIELDPAAFWAHHLLGDLLREEGRNAEALAAYQVANALDPAEPLPYQRLGEVYLSLEQPRAAADAYRQGLEAAPDSADLLAGLALSLEASGDQAGASAAWQSYLEVAPEGMYAEQARARLAGRAGSG